MDLLTLKKSIIADSKSNGGIMTLKGLAKRHPTLTQEELCAAIKSLESDGAVKVTYSDNLPNLFTLVR